MKIYTLSVILLSLFCGVHGETCIGGSNSKTSFCGCQLQDTNGKAVMNISLDFVGIK